jgi:hypothetical protein
LPASLRAFFCPFFTPFRFLVVILSAVTSSYIAIEISQLLPMRSRHTFPQKISPTTTKREAMKKKLDTDDVIENLITATLSEDATSRQRHMFRESLRSLVRLAKAEQVVEIKTNVRRLTGALEAVSARRRAKAVLLAQRLPGILDHGQQQFEFKQ